MKPMSCFHQCTLPADSLSRQTQVMQASPHGNGRLWSTHHSLCVALHVAKHKGYNGVEGHAGEPTLDLSQVVHMPADLLPARTQVTTRLDAQLFRRLYIQERQLAAQVICAAGKVSWCFNSGWGTAANLSPIWHTDQNSGWHLFYSHPWLI